MKIIKLALYKKHSGLSSPFTKCSHKAKEKQHVNTFPKYNSTIKTYPSKKVLKYFENSN